MSGERESSWRAALTDACRRLILAVLLIPLTAYHSPLTCQQSHLIAFQHLRDSLAGSFDTTGLRALLRSSVKHEKANRDDVRAALRTGLVALRLGELGADPGFGKALSSFRRAASREPGWAEPWYGIGLAEAGRGQWEMADGLNLGNRVGLKAMERSVANLQRAVSADAGHVAAALELARVTLRLRDTARLASAGAALRKAATAPGAPPAVILAWARVERASGRPEASLGAFERYLSSGEDRALGLLELARTRLAVGHPDGEIPYYEGASLAGGKVAAEYRSDLAYLLNDSGLAELDSLTGPSLAAYLRRFWTDRDRAELRVTGERLQEHYRRLQFARVHFPLTISRRFYGAQDAYRSGGMEMDDRGLIYVRHGEPSQRLRPFVFGAMPNESWRYGAADGDLLLHFSGGWDHNGGGDLYDYRLVESVLDLRGAGDAPRDQLLLSRQSLSPNYARMLNWGRYGAARARAQERSIGKASIAVGTTTDSYELEFPRRLGAIADLIAVGRTSEGGLAHFVFGIAAEGTTPEVVPEGATYPVRVRLVALDDRGRPIAGLDTTLVIRHQRPLRGGEFLVGRAQLTLPQGRWSYRASLQQGDSAGVVLPLDSVRVGATDQSSFSLSDIALGTRGRAVSWVTDAADTVLFAPSPLFRKEADIELYYEVGGAAARRSYHHEITVLRAGRRGSASRRPIVALSFDEVATGSVIRSRRTVQLGRLKEGGYLVEVRVTAPDGAVEERSRAIRIIDR